jgi:hypothetical protein
MPTPPAAGVVTLDGTGLLIAPDSYVKSNASALYARAPVRQGEPQTLGPFSTWKQADWAGGIGRFRWYGDEAGASMFYWGTADVRDGYAQPRFTLQQRTEGLVNGASEKLLVVRAQNENSNPNLYFGSEGATYLRRVASLTGASTLMNMPNADLLTAMARSNAASASMYAMHLGAEDGSVYTIGHSSETINTKLNGQAADTITMLAGGFGKQDIMAAEQRLWKWREDNAGWSPVGNTDLDIIDGEFWNQRFYILGTDRRTLSCLYITDLITIQAVHIWPSNFRARGITLHEGVLYVTGFAYTDDNVSTVGQLWGYDGETMKLIYEAPAHFADQGPGGLTARFSKSVSYRQWLVFTHGYGGLFYYDPGKDAVLPGPSLKSMDLTTDGWVSNTIVYQNRLVAAAYNEALLNVEDPAFREYQASTIISSEFDAELPDQDKLWHEFRLRLKEPLPAGCSVTVEVTADQVYGTSFLAGGSWATVGTMAVAGEQTARFKAAAVPALANLRRSKTLRYRLTLTPATFSGSATNARPIVASFEVDYQVVPDVRWGWTFTVAARRTDMRMVGGAEYGETPESLEAKLETMLRDPEKQTVEFVDKDGTAYQVAVLDYTKATDMPRGQDAQGQATESHWFRLTLAEV